MTARICSVFFNLWLHQCLQSLAVDLDPAAAAFGVSCRLDEATAPANPALSTANCVSSKDLHIDPNSSLSVRIFLPTKPPPSHHAHLLAAHPRRASDPTPTPASNGAPYRGYLPHAVSSSSRAPASARRRLPIVVQFHGGGFVTGSSSAAANDAFCRRVAKFCNAIIIAVGYRLAPESRYPAAFVDGVKVLKWIAKQANLAMMSKVGSGVDTFGASTVDPWIAAHGDPARQIYKLEPQDQVCTCDRVMLPWRVIVGSLPLTHYSAIRAIRARLCRSIVLPPYMIRILEARMIDSVRTIGVACSGTS